MVRRCSSHEKRDSAQVKAKDDGELYNKSWTAINFCAVVTMEKLEKLLQQWKISDKNNIKTLNLSWQVQHFANIQKVTLKIVFNLRNTEDKPPTANPYTHLKQPHPQHQSHL